MSTRGGIGFGPDGTHWKARYHHFDSYPDGLGKTLFDLHRGFFGRDVADMQRVLFDEHPAGWSSINDTDFTLAPGYTMNPDDRRPRCYCHGERHEDQDYYWTPDTFDEEWCYVITPNHQMYVFRPMPYGKKGARLVATVDLDGPEPDWGDLGVEEDDL